jgi:hypothetical protein
MPEEPEIRTGATAIRDFKKLDFNMSRSGLLPSIHRIK